MLAFVRLDAERNRGDVTRELEKAIRHIPEVVSCHYISGTGTFELQVMATDLDAFSRFSINTLLKLPNVICTPHLGYAVTSAFEYLYGTAIDSILGFAAGKPVNILNPEALTRP